MVEKEVVIPFVPRVQFLPFHKRKQRWACLICHRRCGKTFATLMDLMLKALSKPGGRYAYIAPLYNQAKKVAWDVLKQFARPVLASAPNEAELRVDLLGGSRISLYGGDNGETARARSRRGRAG
jgi:phage terminase large subunit